MYIVILYVGGTVIFLLAGTLKYSVARIPKSNPSKVVGQPLTAGREAGAGGSRDMGPLAGAGPSTGVGTRGIIEEVMGGELGVAEGMGMEEMEVY